jgi:hypothetical protein
MKKQAREIIGYALTAIGIILIIAKIIDWLISAQYLAPSLILLGLLIIAIGLLLMKKGPNPREASYAMPKKYKG